MSTGKLRVPDTQIGPHETEQPEKVSRQGAAFEVLSNERRRRIVHVLLLHDEDEITLRELSRQVAAWENDVEPEDVTLAQRKRVYTALTQSHLPRMDDHGFVEYDDERNVVRPTDRAADLRLYLEVRSHGRIPWSVCYASVGIVGLGLVAAKAVGLFPFSEVSALWWAAALAALFTASGVVHACVRRQSRLESAGPPSVDSETG